MAARGKRAAFGVLVSSPVFPVVTTGTEGFQLPRCGAAVIAMFQQTIGVVGSLFNAPVAWRQIEFDAML